MRTCKDVIACLLLWSAAFSSCAADTDAAGAASLTQSLAMPPAVTGSRQPVSVSDQSEAADFPRADGRSDPAATGTDEGVTDSATDASGDSSYDARSTGSISRYRAQNAKQSNFKSDNGIHLSMEGERPSLAYRFSESGVLRLRGNIREPRLVFSWSY
ncbi:hypothetical protein BH11PSE11_BH11PSE11_28030 [soil metagenome]